MASVVQIGNSRGIRLPKRILRDLRIKDEAEMIVSNDSLIIKKRRKETEGRLEQGFFQIAL